MSSSSTAPPPPVLLVALAFGAIYLVWGSTYLAIRMVVETLPAFTSAGFRFLVAGAGLMGLLLLQGNPLPSARQWRSAAITGALLLVGGNGLVVFAAKSLASGLIALLIALTPMWFALLEWARPGGTRPSFRTIAGIVIGFGGMFLLLKGQNPLAGQANSLPGILAALGAGISWAAGSLYAKHQSAQPSPWVHAASQMLCGGAGLLLLGTISGEYASADWRHVSWRSAAALAYLIVFGSWIGFSSYVWLLKISTPERIATYAYVNPVVALVLGWAILDETITASMVWGTIIIVSAVILISIPGTWAKGGVRFLKSRLDFWLPFRI